MFHFNCLMFVFISTAFVNGSRFEKLKHRIGILVDKLIESKEFREEIALLNFKNNSSYADDNKHCPRCEERKDLDLTAKNYQDDVIATLTLMKRTLSKEKSVARRSIYRLENEVIDKFNGILDRFNDIKNEINEIKVKQEVCDNKIDLLGDKHKNYKESTDIFHDKIVVIDEIKRISEQILRRTETQNIMSKTFWHVFGDSFYFIGKESITWMQAVDTCEALDAYLVQIEDSTENDLLTNVTKLTFSESNGKGVWIGGSDLRQEGIWIWEQSKSNITYSNWKIKEPNGRRRENCLHIYKQSGWFWNDISCVTKMGFICERGS